MPNYIYECKACQEKAIKENPDKLTIGHDGEKELQLDLYEQLVLFETSHGMDPTEEELKEAVVCPRCGGGDASKSFYGAQIHSYTLGYGYCDKSGAKRDMDLFTLKNDDPYAEHRVPGEVDDIASKLKRGPTPKKKHFTTTSDKPAKPSKSSDKKNG